MKKKKRLHGLRYASTSNLPYFENYDQYGFGGWLKENAGTIGGVAGGLIGSFIAPGVGTAIGGSLGSAIGRGIGGLEDEETILPEYLARRQPLTASSNISPMRNGGCLPCLKSKVYKRGGRMQGGFPINELTTYEGNSHEDGGILLGENTEVENREVRSGDTIHSEEIKITKPMVKRFGREYGGPVDIRMGDIGTSIADKVKNIDNKFNRYPGDMWNEQSRSTTRLPFDYMSELIAGEFEQEGYDNYGGYNQYGKGGKWIQGAVNPKHKGYCTPMTKKTCTPHRKALARRFKSGEFRHKKQHGGPYGIGDGYAVPGEMPNYGKVQRGNIGGPAFDILDRLAYNSYNKNYVAGRPKSEVEEQLLNTPNQDWYMNNNIKPTIEGYRGVEKFMNENPDYTKKQWNDYRFNERSSEGSFGSPIPVYGEYTRSSPERLMDFYKKGSTRWSLPGMYKRQQLISGRKGKEFAKGGNILGAMPLVGSLANIGYSIFDKPDEVNYARVPYEPMKRTFLDPTSDLENINSTWSGAIEGMRRTSPQDYLRRLSTLSTGKTRQLSKTTQDYANANAAIANQAEAEDTKFRTYVDVRNAEIQRMEEIDKARNDQARDNSFMSGIRDLFTQAGQVGRDINMTEANEEYNKSYFDFLNKWGEDLYGNKEVKCGGGKLKRLSRKKKK